jgi:folate/biopterin transporter
MTIFSPELSRFKNSLTEKIFLGNEPSPELIAILMVYFVQGILGLARLAVSFFLKDQLGLSPAQVSALMGIAALPWMVKPLFGFLSDGLPIWGYRRRPYLVLAGVLGATAWIGLATIVHTAWAATLAISLSSLAIAISDVIVDSLVVERARQESLSDAGSLQSLCWGSSALGGLLTAYFSGSLLQHFNTQTVFGITATFPLIVSLVAGLIAEERVEHSTDWSVVKHQVVQLKAALVQRSIWMPTAFLFIWQATPTADSAFFFFTTNELKFSPEFLGRVRLVSSIAALLGVWMFHRFFKSVPFRTIFGWTTVLSAALGMTMLLLVTHTNRLIGIDDYWFSLGDSLILTVMGQIAYMPVLVLAARLCPPGVEATLFALLMSVTNLAALFSYESGAWLMHGLGITEIDFNRLWILVVITNLSTLLPLPFLSWLPGTQAPLDAQASPTPGSLPLSASSALDFAPVGTNFSESQLIPEMAIQAHHKSLEEAAE